MSWRALLGWRNIFLPTLVMSLFLGCGEPVPKSQPTARYAARKPSIATVRHVQVSAHPDDDILFMNPDLAAGIRNGQSTVGIYLTGGESSTPAPEQYAAERQEGTRASYAEMAGVPNEWNQTTVAVRENRFVEVNELKSRPEIKLVFLNLPEDNNPAASGGKHALVRLWEDTAKSLTVETIVPNGGKVRESYSYNRTDVITTLAELFELFRPSTIRLQDAQPDTRYQPQWTGFHNHPDHVVGARFARQAAQRFLSRPGRKAVLQNYRDYNVADAPINLSASDRQRKRKHFAAYAEHDSQASLGGAYDDWTTRSYYRWKRGASWVGTDTHGRAHAFAVHGMEVTHWSRDLNGQWQGPRKWHSPEPFRPTLRITRDHQNRLVLVAQTMDGQHLLMKRQDHRGEWPGTWQDIGQPHQNERADLTQIGVPTIVVDRYGRLVVLVKNARGGVSVRRESHPGSGVWERQWRHLGGTHVQDGLSAALDEHGQLHVFASSNERILHWQEQGQGGHLEQVPFTDIRPAGKPEVVRAADGRIRLMVREAGGARLVAFTSPGSRRRQQPEALLNPGGIAPPVTVSSGDPARPRVLTFIRDSMGKVSAAQGRGGRYGGWVNLGGQVLDHPAPLVEPDGTVTLLATGMDGKLLVNKEIPNTLVLTFQGWEPAVRSHPADRDDHPIADGGR